MSAVGSTVMTALLVPASGVPAEFGDDAVSAALELEMFESKAIPVNQAVVALISVA